MNKHLPLIKELSASIEALDFCRSSEPLLDTIDIIIQECVTALSLGGKLIFIGNGGSAADAQHMAAEYVGKYNFDRAPLAAVALTTDSSIISAVGNDYGFNKVFSRQLAAIGKKNDILFGYSTSGNSENIVEAIVLAKELGIKTIAFTGNNHSKIKDIADYVISAPSRRTSIVQECHAVIGHLICCMVEQKIFKK